MRFSESLWKELLLLAIVAWSMSAQTPSAETVLRHFESEEAKFVNDAVDAGFPDGSADGMTMLVINQAALVVPLLESRIELELGKNSPSNSLIATASEIIAYAGSEQSLQAASRLIAIDAERFGALVERTLDNAIDFRNSCTVAYRGLAMDDEAVSERIGRWAASRLPTRRMQRLWADAMLDRYGGVPGDRQWAQDAIATRIGVVHVSSLKGSVTEYARRAQELRRR